MIETLEKYVRRFTNLLCFLGMILLALLMFLGALDVVGRYFFNFPIKGTYEMSEVLLAGVVFFGLAYTQSERGHVSVDSFVTRFHPRVQAVTGAVISLMSFVIFALISWQGTVLAHKSWESGRLIDVISIPIAPFQLLVTVGAFAMCLELLVQFLQYLKASNKEV